MHAIHPRRRRHPGALLLPAFLVVAVLPLQTRAADWSDVGGGELLVRDDDGLHPLPIVELDVRIDVTGVMGRGRVTQVFRGVEDATVDAVYAFPLPDRAAVHRMEIRIGERRIVAEIREKEEARQTYEEARARGQRAALTEQRRPDLFTTEVANIGPGETVSVELEYVEELRYDDGAFALRFPLTYLPRFLPPGSSDEGVARGTDVRVPSARISIRLAPGFPLRRVESPSHAIDDRESHGVRLLRPVGERVPADRDLVLRWQPALQRRSSGHLLLEEHEGRRYAMAIFLPPDVGHDPALAMPTETLFIIDVSGSMSGPSIEQARRALGTAIGRLRPEDRFNVMRFNEGSSLFVESFRYAEEDAVAEAKRWIDGLEARGGTMIEPALQRGMALMRESDAFLLQRIVFLTDGAVGNDRELLQAIHEGLGDVRLHTIGIGHAPNVRLMRKMAERGRGLSELIASTDEADNRIARFLERIDRPVLAGLKLDVAEAGLSDVVPRVLPDLHAGEPLVISARVDPGADPTRLRLGGYTRDGWIELGVVAHEPATVDSGVGLRWARARVAELMDRLVEGADGAAVRREVLGLALEHRLVTAYTSLVAVEDFPSVTPPPAGLRAAALPLGGTDRRLRTAWGVVLSLLGLWALRLARRPPRPA